MQGINALAFFNTSDKEKSFIYNFDTTLEPFLMLPALMLPAFNAACLQCSPYCASLYG
jgi:hypothetical protein